jgi:hypothetical protein
MNTTDTPMSSELAVETNTVINECHPLYDKWVLWAHLPHDTDWSIRSYKKISDITSVEQMLSLYSILPEKLIKNCMLFLMRDGIDPMWEHPSNRDGGCFSYKVTNKQVLQAWKNLSYILVGETLTNNPTMGKIINGITISPKRAFCIVKVWLKNCKIQNPQKLTVVPGLSSQGCLFKRHKPEY